MTELLVALGVGVGAGVGAQLRYAVERVHARARTRRGLTVPTFPWATLTVNVVGSALLGLVAALVVRAGLDARWLTVLGTGVAGGLTTFSTLSLDLVELVRQRRYGTAALDVALHVVLGIGAAVGAFHLVP
ncbi:CrcB family protein [Cellulomonas fimi]|uniref:Fluoride-specific ion channel FluC n=1 Tax=Cellulomonas fimi TaxID=1708 RepID=A0A7Y0QGI8_CELFI|nr:CrcB family protein [Cellulomonas fimi]NMR19143.1 CrcB family protein [Cellulomonas fimi]